MKLTNLKVFDPEKIANIETNMWRAYYKHNFFKLFRLVLQLIREQFHLNYLNAFKVAYYTAFAATLFRMSRGRENENLIFKKLVKAFKIISLHATENFDYKKAALLEVEWWMIDRYPERYKTSRREGLKNALTSIYGANAEELTEYAEYRAQAMELNDEAEKQNEETDWEAVNSLLLNSYQSLHKVIN